MDVTIAQELRDLIAGIGRLGPDETLSEAHDVQASENGLDTSAVLVEVEEPQGLALTPTSEDAPPVASEDSATPLEVSVVEDIAPPLTSRGPGWAPVLLRRDGKRPKRFTGVQVVAFEGQCRLGDWECSQSVTLFQAGDVDEEVYLLALHLQVPDWSGARPVYDCLEVDAGNLADALRHWFLRVQSCVPAVRTEAAPPPPQIDEPGLAAGFHAITAHCFRAEQVPQERNEKCLQ